MRIKLMLGLFLAFVTMSSFTSIQHPATTEMARWELLGACKVNYGVDRDEILVTRSEGHFDALKVLVKRSPIHLHKIVVHFGNGDVQEFEARHNIPAGGASPVINLAGNNRIIQKVVFWYDTKDIAARKGVVELWGKH
jgi:hypothetical protein